MVIEKSVQSQRPPSVISMAKDATRNDDSNPQQGSGSSGLQVKETSKQESSFEKTPFRNSLKIPPTKKDSRKLFVGGLPADITDDEFRIFFAQFGKLVDSIVMFDRETHRSRGFGFVTYEDPEVCRFLLSMGNEGQDHFGERLVGRLEMRGKIVEMKSAEPKESAPNRRFYGTTSTGNSGDCRNQLSANTVVNMLPIPPSVSVDNSGEPPLAFSHDTGASADPSQYQQQFFPPAAMGYMAPPTYFQMQPPAFGIPMPGVAVMHGQSFVPPEHVMPPMMPVPMQTPYAFVPCFQPPQFPHPAMDTQTPPFAGYDDACAAGQLGAFYGAQ